MYNQFEAGSIESYKSGQVDTDVSLLIGLTREDWQEADSLGRPGVSKDNYDPSDYIPRSIDVLNRVRDLGDSTTTVGQQEFLLIPPVNPSFRRTSSDSGADQPSTPRECDTTCDIDAEAKVLVERWNKLINDAEIPKGPYRDVLVELGEQLISGKFDQAKIQKMLEQESRRLQKILDDGDRDSIRNALDEYRKFDHALRKISDKLRKEGIGIDFIGRGVSISEPARKQEWIHNLSLDEHGTEQGKRRFHDPSARGWEAMRHDKENVTAEAAFKALSVSFKRALSQQR